MVNERMRPGQILVGNQQKRHHPLGSMMLQFFCITMLLSACMATPEPKATAEIERLPSPTISLQEDILGEIVQQSIDLNGEWYFRTDPEDRGEQEGWAERSLDDMSWEAVQVPHTWNVMQPYAEYEGVAWYRKHFVLPHAPNRAHLRLHFEAVFYQAMVWLNGNYLGAHEGGYTPFEFDVSRIADPDSENILAVRVDNLRLPNRIPDDFFDWWHYGGIVRDVSIEATDPVYIDRLQIVAIPHLTGWDEADQATITTKAILVNASSDVFEGALIAQVVYEANGQPVLGDAAKVDVKIPPGEKGEVELQISIDDPKLWHFDHPHLYRWVTSLEDHDGRVFHEEEDTFGVRLIELKEAQFFFNGEPVRLVGITRHADSPQYGLAEPVSIMAADLDDAKRLNVVLSRPVHYPQHKFILDYCDRNGILLSPEIPAWQIEASHLGNPDVRAIAKQQLREMILWDFNHPSIWAWSVANEIDSNTPQGHQYVRELMDLAKELDLTRPVGFASYRLFDHPELDATAFTDFVFMNEYAGSWHGTKSDLPRALERIHDLWPEKVVIISEFGLEAGWTADWWMGPASQYDSEEYYYIAPNTHSDSDEVYAQRDQLILDQMDIFRSYPFVAGAIFWTYQDYRSETDFHLGIVNADRQPTPAWQVLREQYSPVIIEEVTFSPRSNGLQRAAIRLRTRGPVEEALPAYTLRGYRVRCDSRSVEDGRILSQHDAPLPTLPPGERWLGEVQCIVPMDAYLISVGVVRSTGFDLIERVFTSEGEPLPSDH